MRTIQQYRKDHPQLSEEQVHSAYHITEIDAPEFAVSGFTLIARGKCLAIHENGNIAPLRLKESYGDRVLASVI
jgi:hypothetical protein